MVEIKEIEIENESLAAELRNSIKRVMEHFERDEVRIKARYNIEKLDSSSWRKCERRFEQHKAHGNELFAKRLYEEAALEYSEAIIFAKSPAESNQISFAFGNRSAALFELRLYQQCFEDIECAIKYGYPSDRRQKLMKRRELCLQTIDNRGNQRKSAVNAGFRNSIKINECRKVVSTSAITKGEMILIEQAWCTSLSDDYYFTHCYNCLKRIDAKRVFPCFQCTKIRFCSERCSLEAWECGHRYECGYIDIWKTLFFEISDKPIQLAAKAVLRADLLKVFDALRAGKETEDSYSEILKLRDPGDKCKDFSKTAALLLTYFGEFAKLPPREKGRSVRQDTELLGALLLKHLQQIQVNSVEITEHNFSCGNVNETAKLFNEQTIGHGLFPMVSTVEHSCDPNAQITSFDGRDLILSAVRDIEQGEKITISLGVTFRSHALAARLKYLKENYFFECKCIACSAQWQSKCNAFKCPQCHGPVVKESETCLQCGKRTIEDFSSLEIELIKVITSAKSGAMCLIHKQPDLRRAEHILVECYRALVPLLYPCNKHFGYVNDQLSLCYKLMKKFEWSVKYAREALNCIEQEFGEENFNYLNALLKLIDREKCFLENLLTKREKSKENEASLIKTNESFRNDLIRARRLINLLTLPETEQRNYSLQMLTELENDLNELYKRLRNN
ncbi:SET and MYND domain-containing protein 4-like protein [Dinothrombium tinctorium]|uniref:SET and MYND domain-containing protein 4-like protein n=1 Tax=Dinothrombium tinctorium TaxID=1965070 RepID=A0A3S3QMA8_9ACAR|nr:SET and MYND domain-containing protein 4-like protein [Dinothrombium tinctorium]